MNLESSVLILKSYLQVISFNSTIPILYSSPLNINCIATSTAGNILKGPMKYAQMVNIQLPIFSSH